MLKLKKISDEQEIDSSVLRERFVDGSRGRTHDFIVLSGDCEAGILIYENWGEYGGFIYEIFVLKDYRQRGVANWILSQAENIAAELGHSAITLDARTLDRDELSHNDLAAWYSRRGYVWLNSETGRLEKTL
jgi:GNAT superfamily N-acetyltransferase